MILGVVPPVGSITVRCALDQLVLCLRSIGEENDKSVRTGGDKPLRIHGPGPRSSGFDDKSDENLHTHPRTTTDPSRGPEMTNEAALPEQCRQNGCTGEDCVCWQDEDEAEDAKLLDAAFARTDVHPAGWMIEYIDDARMLTLLGPGGHPSQRLYLDENTGLIDSVPLHVEYAIDARDLLDGTTDRRQASLDRL